ncbi:2-dehydro-3-deoxygluconokinase [Paenibacillus sp. UNCCL117]|nr:2-dehydro-3-deoxygluconokinase [Paenibacillus sp. cl123]SFW17850.1 2-dehydro-3-deoxygluconokinase [Paenibacillus sp. UNCCL117]
MVTMNPKSKGPLRYVAEFERRVGGAELNLAIGCARLGLRTAWISRLGDDEFGRFVYNFARGEGIDVSNVKLMEGYATSVNFKEIREDGAGRTFYYRMNSPTLTLNAEDLPADDIKKSRILHITGVFSAIRQNDMSVIHKAIEIAKANNVLVAFDPNIRFKLWSKEEAKHCLTHLLPYVDIMLTGEEEAEFLLGVRDLDKMISKFTEYGIGCVAIKQGSQGSVGYYEGRKVSKPAIKVSTVADTVGAGDGFDAGFLHGIINGWPLEKTLTFANLVGSMVVSVAGDNEGLPYYEEVMQKLGVSEFIER